MSNQFFLMALPYISVIIFITGSIFRWFNQSYKVSSLSTQFLEPKGLYWGSNPFHWGIMFVLTGHLVAFIAPKSIIFWNSITLRLLILEITAFAFALASLFGLVVLISRRLKNDRLKVVTSKMDVLVYITLAVQIGSGLWVAYFNRWGSTWFAGVITPYLYSLFKFNPNIAAVSAMAVSIKIHMVSAFIIIGLIPFTRYFHFMAFPFKYIWRNTQVVMWNWNRKTIRKSM